jgi:hypothetical protein
MLTSADESNTKRLEGICIHRLGNLVFNLDSIWFCLHIPIPTLDIVVIVKSDIPLPLR